MKIAALDLGSNTFLCLIAEVSATQIIKIYSDTAEVVRLGQGLANLKKFHPEALQRADECLKKFSQIIKVHKPEKILAMATSAARDATNSSELFAIAEKYNIPLEIISGKSEAAITYEGAISGLNSSEQNFLVIDIGGGSTEFIFGRDQKVIIGESYNIGCVRLTEKFITKQPTPASEIQDVIDFVDEHILKARTLKPAGFLLNQIVAVAGTPTSIAAAEIGHFESSKIDGYVLDRKNLSEWVKKLIPATVDEKIKMGIPPGRADVILVGVIILLRTLVLFDLNQMLVSTKGVRYGIAHIMGRRFLSRY